MLCCYVMLMGLRAGSRAHGNADMVSEGNSGAPGRSPQGLAPCSLRGRAQSTVPRCPPFTHCRQRSVEAPAGAAAWRRPGCPGHLPLPTSKVQWPDWRALACWLLRPAWQGGGRLGHPRAPHRMRFGGWVWVPAVLPCGCGCGLGRVGRGGMSSLKLAPCGEG